MAVAQIPEAAAEQAATPRRSTTTGVAAAIDLGWRVAALHALRPTTLTPPSPVGEDMLLNRRSLSAADRAGARGARDRGRGEDRRRRDAGGRPRPAARAGDGCRRRRRRASRRFARRSRASTSTFEKRLWSVDEPSGKAYELGNFLSDTWNRVVRPREPDAREAELRAIFDPIRVERIKLLLDDLQARIDPVAVHAVDQPPRHVARSPCRDEARVAGAHARAVRRPPARAGRAPDGDLAPDADRRQGARGLDQPCQARRGARRGQQAAVDALPAATGGCCRCCWGAARGGDAAGELQGVRTSPTRQDRAGPDRRCARSGRHRRHHARGDDRRR